MGWAWLLTVVTLERCVLIPALRGQPTFQDNKRLIYRHERPSLRYNNNTCEFFFFFFLSFGGSD